MKVTADSNVLIRAAVRADLHQARRAAKILAEADLIAVPVPVLREFVRDASSRLQEIGCRYFGRDSSFDGERQCRNESTGGRGGAIRARCGGISRMV